MYVGYTLNSLEASDRRQGSPACC